MAALAKKLRSLNLFQFSRGFISRNRMVGDRILSQKEYDGTIPYKVYKANLIAPKLRQEVDDMKKRLEWILNLVVGSLIITGAVIVAEYEPPKKREAKA